MLFTCGFLLVNVRSFFSYVRWQEFVCDCRVGDQGQAEQASGCLLWRHGKLCPDTYVQCCVASVSVADPGCLPWIRLFPSRNPNKEFKYFNPKISFLSSRQYDPGCSSRIRIMIFTHPGSRHGYNIGFLVYLLMFRILRIRMFLGLLDPDS
jgi:hypothetical protein